MLLGQIVKLYRTKRNLSLRQLAKEIEVDYNALYRFEIGGQIDMANCFKIFMWLMSKPNNNKK